MTRLIILLSLLYSSGSIWAHQPDRSSTILAEREDGSWVLQVRAALTAFEYEVEARFGASAYATPEEFRELVLDHLRRKIIVRFNGGTLTTLENGVVKLGHETTATFWLRGAQEAVAAVMLRNAAFGNISHNQSALFVVKEGFAREQFLLTEGNSHTAELRVGDGKFVLAASGGESAGLLPLLLLGGFGLLAWLIYRKGAPVSSFFEFRGQITETKEL